jgi:hypothetical protein
MASSVSPKLLRYKLTGTSFREARLDEIMPQQKVNEREPLAASTIRLGKGSYH